MHRIHETPTGATPRAFAWIIESRLAVAERLGGAGRSHRAARRAAAQAWWRERGATDIVSAMRTRHGLLEYALDGFGIHHLPLEEPENSGEPLVRLAQRAEHLLVQDRCIVVRVDRPNGRLCGVDASLRLGLGVCGGPAEASLQAARGGFPVDDEPELLLKSYSDAAGGVKLA